MAFDPRGQDEIERQAKDMVEYYVARKMTATAVQACLDRVQQENTALHIQLMRELKEYERRRKPT